MAKTKQCTCGAASVPGLQGLHADHCLAKQTLGQKFWKLYRLGIDGTFPIVEYLAPKLIEDRGPNKPPVINIKRFWEVFGPEVDYNDPTGLEWCFNQREGDHGSIAYEELGGQQYWTEVW